MKISVVIPVRNEARSIGGLLESLAVQSLQPAEVVVVDGGSTDGTTTVIEEWIGANASRLKVRLIRAQDATPGRGRNLGIAAAEGEWIALTDAGMVVEPTWLERLAAAQGASGCRVVYGNVEPVTDTFWERCSALAYVPPKAQRPGGRMRGPCVPSSLLDRSVWEEAGGFPDLRATEDLAFLEKLEELGCTPGWAPNATVWWKVQASPTALFRKFALYSLHNVRAGRQQQWHYGVARKYALALPFFILAIVHSKLWLLGPLLGHGARTVHSIWSRREGKNWASLLDPLQFAGVALALLVIDAGMFLGWIQAALPAHERVVREAEAR
jgi:glycosyltransferase involved in cell wall biosynthesis